MGDAEKLKQAVYALYAPTSPAKTRGEANAWLMSFTATFPAWEAARTALSDPDEKVQFIGANMFKMKVCSEWHSLPEGAKAQIYGVLKEVVGKIPVGAPDGFMRLTAASKQLCLALAAAAVRSGALESFATDALTLAKDPSGKGAAVAIELLIALPQELLERTTAQAPSGDGGPMTLASSAPTLKRVQSGEGAMLEGRPELRGLLPQVLQLLTAVVEHFGAGSGPEHAECVTQCLKCLEKWNSLEMGYSLVMLADSFPALLQCVLGAFTSPVEPLVVAAADAFVELLSSNNTVLSVGVERQVCLRIALGLPWAFPDPAIALPLPCPCPSLALPLPCPCPCHWSPLLAAEDRGLHPSSGCIDPSDLEPSATRRRPATCERGGRRRRRDNERVPVPLLPRPLRLC